MTRINCVPAAELTRQHTFAEYREMPRVRRMDPERHKGKLPLTYRMGPGHVLFFLDKGLWLMARHRELRARLVNRWGYRLTVPLLDLWHWPQWALRDWTPDARALAVNRARIFERLHKNQLTP